jgi:hypothetical protein
MADLWRFWIQGGEVMAVSACYAGIVFSLSLITSTMSCGVEPSRSQASVAKSSPESSATPQKRDAQYDRVAIPDIKGCPRDDITFYKGKVLSFKRDESMVEISIKTEWNTTEKLSQSEKSIEFRLNNQPLKELEWKDVESMLSDPSHQPSATVWVCRVGGKDQVKIIDWQKPAQ